MSLVLEKGANINLTKGTGLTKAMLGLGWDPQTSGGAEFDLDASVFMLDANGKLTSDKSVIYYGHLKSDDGSIVHSGDNLTGGGDGDDEQINVDLTKIPANVEKLAFVVTIYQAAERKQNFGQVKNAFIRVVNPANNEQIAKYDLTEDFSDETAVVFGELYRKDGDWKFKAIGEGHKSDLGSMCRQYGLAA